MDYFEIMVDGTPYLVKPFIENDNLQFAVEINDREVLFAGTGNGLAVIDPAEPDNELYQEIASRIDSHLM